MYSTEGLAITTTPQPGTYAMNSTKASDSFYVGTDSLGVNGSTRTALTSTYWELSHNASQAYLNSTGLSPEECELKALAFEEKYSMIFDRLSLIRVFVTWIIFLISAAGNTFVLASVTFRSPSRSHSHSQIMMAHLTVANLAFTLFFLPTDAIWQTTIQWYGGDFLCRLTNVLKQLSMYSSSAMVVAMGVDRVLNLMWPLSRILQRKRILKILGVAWGFSLINAIPAGVIFQVINHRVNESCPQHVVQCVDLTVSQEANLRPYYMYTLFISFFGPLICILISYVLIAYAISKMAKVTKEAQQRSLHQNCGSKRGLDRARRISLIVTVLISATFIICWGPYYVTGLLEWFKKESKLSRTAETIMVMSVNLNPMLHPLITIWLIKEIRDSITIQFKRNRKKPYLSAPKKKTSPNKYNNSNGCHAGARLLAEHKDGTPKTQEVWL